jgi:hypothetical protein
MKYILFIFQIFLNLILIIKFRKSFTSIKSITFEIELEFIALIITSHVLNIRQSLNLI